MSSSRPTDSSFNDRMSRSVFPTSNSPLSMQIATSLTRSPLGETLAGDTAVGETVKEDTHDGEPGILICSRKPLTASSRMSLTLPHVILRGPEVALVMNTLLRT